MHLNTCSTDDGSYLGRVSGGASLKEVYPWGQTWRFSSLTPPRGCSLCFMSTAEDVFAQLPEPAVWCHTCLGFMESLSATISPKKLTSSLVMVFYHSTEKLIMYKCRCLKNLYDKYVPRCLFTPSKLWLSLLVSSLFGLLHIIDISLLMFLKTITHSLKGWWLPKMCYLQRFSTDNIVVGWMFSAPMVLGIRILGPVGP